MIKSIRNLLAPKEAQPLPSVPPGERIYAIGDIHGRLDLFTALANAIEADDGARGDCDSQIILLGDLIDRGPESARVVSAARALCKRRGVRVLCGNHEEMFLRSFDNLSIFRSFMLHGGRETILSYPIDAQAFHTATLPEAQEMMVHAVPRADREFIDTFEDFIVIGDYLFVHAGIRPGEALEDQRVTDLRWIREPFLSHIGNHGYVVVHGHTIADQAEIESNRIGIDTGAFMSGRLTALGLEGDSRWLIEAEATNNGINVTTRRV